MSLLRLLAEHADKLPFIVAVNGAHMRVQLSFQRIFEAVVIGAVLALIGYIAVIPRLEERVTLEISHIRADISRLDRKLELLDAQRQRDYRELNNRRRDEP